MKLKKICCLLLAAATLALSAPAAVVKTAPLTAAIAALKSVTKLQPWIAIAAIIICFFGRRFRSARKS